MEGVLTAEGNNFNKNNKINDDFHGKKENFYSVVRKIKNFFILFFNCIAGFFVNLASKLVDLFVSQKHPVTAPNDNYFDL